MGSVIWSSVLHCSARAAPGRKIRDVRAPRRRSRPWTRPPGHRTHNPLNLLQGAPTAAGTSPKLPAIAGKSASRHTVRDCSRLGLVDHLSTIGAASASEGILTTSGCGPPGRWLGDRRRRGEVDQPAAQGNPVAFRRGVRRALVRAGGRKVAGSNPVAPT